MATIQFVDGQILFEGGSVAMHEDCCCGGGGGGVDCSSCPSDTLSETLALTITASTCPSIDAGDEATLVWDGSQYWEGTMNCGGGGTVAWRLSCSVGGAFEMTWGGSSSHDPTSTTCNPFELVYANVEPDVDMCSPSCESGVGQSISYTITE